MPILHWLNDDQARKTSSRVPYRLLEADAARREHSMVTDMLGEEVLVVKQV
jgi:hypothetical protein